ncbi:LOW QUALITY PROTEIN: hypothetical protein SORBI_3001G361400 [Sorghum bicolor]|uniref:NAD(P)-binding domain-containing protein n=1 Tax=Sorghum bicolor TaxID=4558 RepID=A0A1B6QMZ5_SORBI|nr:LOW QUALITY PROTEIN: hypothetical protein SORBI_3001G361400 [Sorghum bicolor]
MDAAGPLGHALVDRLLQRGYTVHAATYAACSDGDEEEEEEATTAALLRHLSSCGVAYSSVHLAAPPSSPCSGHQSPTGHGARSVLTAAGSPNRTRLRAGEALAGLARPQRPQLPATAVMDAKMR